MMNKDFALVKLRDKLDFNLNDTTKPMVNAICLPKENIYNSDPEYALISGYGYYNNNDRGTKVLDRMGWVKINGATNDANDEHGGIIFSNNLDYNGSHSSCG